MAQVTAETSYEGRIDNALNLMSISTRLGCSSQTYLGPNNPSEIMAFTRSTSTSPSRSRAWTTNATGQDQMSRPKFSSVDLPFREPSQTRYILHLSYEDLRMGKSYRSRNEPRYVENYLESSHADDDSYPQRETATTTPPSESGEQLTPLTNTSSRKSEDGGLKEPPILTILGSNVLSAPEELQSPAPETSDAIEEVDSMFKMFCAEPNNNSGDFAADEDDEIDNESESENDSIEERWVSTDEDFEASVLRATENNFNLAARLIPQLYEMFQQEESSVVGFWETCYRTRVGNSYNQGSATQGRGGGSFGSYTGQHSHDRKRQRKDDEGNGEEDNNNQEGNRDGGWGNTKGGTSGSSYPQPLACPFNKKYPLKYNGSYRSPHGGRKGEYRTCDSGFDNENCFREHLKRNHRFVQCAQCSRMFPVSLGDWKKRQKAFQTHRSKPEECSNTPPPKVNEGITELQWSEIDDLPRQPRSTDISSKFNPSVVKWNSVWNILFPGEEPPQPWHTLNINTIRQPSSLDDELAEFKRCYDSNELFSPMENAIHAFEAWFIKRRMEQPALQQTQQEMSQMTLQEYAGMQTEYSPREEGQSMQSTPFPNTTPSQGRAEMLRFPSHQQTLQNSSNRREFQDMLPPGRRSITDTNLGYQAYGQMPGHTEPNVTQLPGQQTMYPPEFGNSMTMYAGSGQLPNPFTNTPSFPLGFQTAVPMNYGVSGNFNNNPVDHRKYNNNSTPFNMNGAPQFQQNNAAAPLPRSQHPTYDPNQPQVYGAHQPQAWTPPSGSTDNQMYGHRPMQPQQATNAFSYPKPHPQRSVAPDTSSLSDPNAEEDLYNDC